MIRCSQGLAKPDAVLAAILGWVNSVEATVSSKRVEKKSGKRVESFTELLDGSVLLSILECLFPMDFEDLKDDNTLDTINKIRNALRKHFSYLYCEGDLQLHFLTKESMTKFTSKYISSITKVDDFLPFLELIWLYAMESSETLTYLSANENDTENVCILNKLYDLTKTFYFRNSPNIRTFQYTPHNHGPHATSHASHGSHGSHGSHAAHASNSELDRHAQTPVMNAHAGHSGPSGPTGLTALSALSALSAHSSHGRGNVLSASGANSMYGSNHDYYGQYCASALSPHVGAMQAHVQAQAQAQAQAQQVQQVQQAQQIFFNQNGIQSPNLTHYATMNLNNVNNNNINNINNINNLNSINTNLNNTRGTTASTTATTSRRGGANGLYGNFANYGQSAQSANSTNSCNYSNYGQMDGMDGMDGMAENVNNLNMNKNANQELQYQFENMKHSYLEMADKYKKLKEKWGMNSNQSSASHASHASHVSHASNERKHDESAKTALNILNESLFNSEAHSDICISDILDPEVEKMVDLYDRKLLLQEGKQKNQIHANTQNNNNNNNNNVSDAKIDESHDGINLKLDENMFSNKHSNDYKYDSVQNSEQGTGKSLDRVVTLNIGGTRFMTCVKTLGNARNEHHLLANILNDEKSEYICKIGHVGSREASNDTHDTKDANETNETNETNDLNELHESHELQHNATTRTATTAAAASTSMEMEPEYFIDRDGTYFRHILNYLRDGKLNILEMFDYPNVLELMREAKFYGLYNEMFENYNTSIRWNFAFIQSNSNVIEKRAHDDVLHAFGPKFGEDWIDHKRSVYWTVGVIFDDRAVAESADKEMTNNNDEDASNAGTVKIGLVEGVDSACWMMNSFVTIKNECVIKVLVDFGQNRVEFVPVKGSVMSVKKISLENVGNGDIREMRFGVEISGSRVVTCVNVNE